MSRHLLSIILFFASAVAFSQNKVAVPQDTATVVIQLKEATVVAKVDPITVAADTVEYNPAAYRLMEDAMLEDLLEKIPGLEINGNTVTLNGREVKQLLIEGQRFFGGNVMTGLKNISADMVAKVRAYDRESDFTRTTGIDDGEREPVLDLKIKKSMMDGWKGNLRAGYGTHNRYQAGLNANKITKTQNSSVVVNFNNLPGKIGIDNASRTQLGSGSGADNQKREAGFNFASKSQKLNVDASVHYDGNDKDSQSHSRSQTVRDSGVSSYDGNSQTLSGANTPSFSARLEWKPTKNWTIVFKPSLKYSGTYSYSQSQGSNYNVSGKLSNSTDNFNRNIRNSFNGSCYFQLTRRFASKRGRSLTFSTSDNFTLQNLDNPLHYSTRYYLIKSNPDSLNLREVTVDEHIRNFNLNGQLSYNEPLGKGFHVQVIAALNHGSKSSVRNVYDSYGGGNLMGEISYDASYQSNTGNVSVNMRYVKKKFNLTAGVSLRPQSSHFHYRDTLGVDTTVRKRAFYVAPNFSLRYNPNKTTRMTLQYRGQVNQPSMYQLMPVSSGTNPLYVHYGNENLFPSFVHIAEFSFNRSDLVRHSSILCDLNWRYTQNRVVSITSYDPVSGGTKTYTDNLNGNWEASGYEAYTKSFGSSWSLSQKASANFHNDVAWLYNSSKKQADLNTSRRLMLKASVDCTYRNDWLELIGCVNGDYTDESNVLRPEMNQKPWSFGGGLKATASLPWKMRLMVDFSLLGQRGYIFEELNREYYILNAGVYQSFLKRKLTISIEGNDLLGQLPSLTRSFGSSSRSIVTFNGYNSYILARMVWKF